VALLCAATAHAQTPSVPEQPLLGSTFTAAALSIVDDTHESALIRDLREVLAKVDAAETALAEEQEKPTDRPCRRRMRNRAAA